MHQASVGFHCPECARQGRQKIYRGAAAIRQRPVATQVFIALNVIVFVADLLYSGGSAVQGGMGVLKQEFSLVARLWELDGSYYIRGIPGSQEVGVAVEPYRMLTSGFLHHGIFHLLINMYALWILGQAVENYAGRTRFVAIYITAILTGSLGALILDPDAFTAGASGGIFGLMGAFMLAQKAQGLRFSDSPLIGILIINAVITFGLPNISVGGHVGGFVGGALAGWLIFHLGPRPGMNKQIPVAACVAVGLACVVIGVIMASGHLPTN